MLIHNSSLSAAAPPLSPSWEGLLHMVRRHTRIRRRRRRGYLFARQQGQRCGICQGTAGPASQQKVSGAPAFAFLNSNWRIPHRNTKKGREIEIEYVRTSEEEREAVVLLPSFFSLFFCGYMESNSTLWRLTAAQLWRWCEGGSVGGWVRKKH